MGPGEKVQAPCLIEFIDRANGQSLIGPGIKERRTAEGSPYVAGLDKGGGRQGGWKGCPAIDHRNRIRGSVVIDYEEVLDPIPIDIFAKDFGRGF